MHPTGSENQREHPDAEAWVRHSLESKEGSGPLREGCSLYGSPQGPGRHAKHVLAALDRCLVVPRLWPEHVML